MELLPLAPLRPAKHEDSERGGYHTTLVVFLTQNDFKFVGIPALMNSCRPEKIRPKAPPAAMRASDETGHQRPVADRLRLQPGFGLSAAGLQER